jgi:hypothetical protein
LENIRFCNTTRLVGSKATALLDYLGILHRIQNEKIRYPEKALHFYSDLTYLRLYRLEAAANSRLEQKKR